MDSEGNRLAIHPLAHSINPVNSERSNNRNLKQKQNSGGHLMKFSKLAKTVCTGAMLATVATFSVVLPGVAQDVVPEANPDINDPTLTNDQPFGTDTDIVEEEEGFDWGLLGLLGLIGLAGLARKPEQRVQYRDPADTTTTTTGTSTGRSDYYR